MALPYLGDSASREARGVKYIDCAEMKICNDVALGLSTFDWPYIGHTLEVQSLCDAKVFNRGL